MKLLAAMEILTKQLKDELVVTNISSAARSLYAAGDRDRNLYSVTMGLASSVGLGLALALPSKKVIAVDGDGSLLMNLGSLATIANENPPNLVLIVADNECYEGPGGQPTATAGKTDLAEVGRGAGIKNSLTVRGLEEFEQAVKKALAAQELSLVVAKVEKETGVKRPMALHRLENTFRFLRALRDEGLIEQWYE